MHHAYNILIHIQLFTIGFCSVKFKFWPSEGKHFSRPDVCFEKIAQIVLYLQ